MQKRDKLLAELNELSKNKRMGSAEDSAKSDCSNLQSQLNTINEELVSFSTWNPVLNAYKTKSQS